MSTIRCDFYVSLVIGIELNILEQVRKSKHIYYVNYVYENGKLYVYMCALRWTHIYYLVALEISRSFRIQFSST